jgi:general secretion pathway protein B
MSFILDALRKSETDRQRQNGPGLVDAGYRPPAARRGWLLPAFIVVVLVNAGVLGFLFLRPASDEPATPLAEAAAPPPAPPPVAPVAGRSLAATAGVAAPEDSPYDMAADLPAVEGEAPVTELLPAAVEPEPEPGAGIVRDSLPTAEQLVTDGALVNQSLRIDIHVWDTEPAKRFVFVNMRKLAEGDELPEGGRIEEITPEGVIIDRNGQRFLLPRE